MMVYEALVKIIKNTSKYYHTLPKAHPEMEKHVEYFRANQHL